MCEISLSDQDIQQIQAHGLTPEQVCQQLRFFARPRRYSRLSRAATVSDGIHRIPPADYDHYLNRHAAAARQGRFTKFIPASGGATRMFELLLHQFYHVDADLKTVVDQELAQGSHRAREFLVFHDCLPQFAFYAELQATLAINGNNLGDLLADRNYRKILRQILTEAGLYYHDRPRPSSNFTTTAQKAAPPWKNNWWKPRPTLGRGWAVPGALDHPPRHRKLPKVLDRIRPALEEMLRPAEPL